MYLSCSKEQKLEHVSLTDSCRDRQHLSNLNCTSSAIAKWSKPLAYGVAITNTSLHEKDRVR